MTQEERQALQRWEETHKAINCDIPVEDWLTRQDIVRKKATLESNTVEWVKYFFGQYASYEFATFHVRALNRIVSHEEWYEVLSWSRELAKSTVAMFALMFLALTGRKKFIILASATIDSAVRLLTPYRISIEMNPRIKQFYGEQQKIGSWTDKDFTLQCGARFVGVGAGSAPRGARNENMRPDVLYMDDFDTDEDCRNPDTLQKKWEWFENALYPTVSISGKALILWCGNIIARDCCIVRAGKMADNWDIVNIRDKDGRSSWPQKNTEEMIDARLRKIGTRAVQTEYYNNPVSEGKIFKNLTFGKIPPLRKFKFIIIYGDPAYSNSRKKGTSFKSVFAVGRLRGVYYIIKGFCAQAVNAEFIDWYFSLVDYVGKNTNVYCYMENNKLQDPFFQQVFRPLIFEANKKRKASLYIAGDDKKKTDKATRIDANLEPIDREGGWIFNEEERDNPHMQELISQFKLFELTLPYAADGPDCIEGAISLTKTKTAELEPTVVVRRDDACKNPYKM